jgi:hypothetical protein
MNTQILPAVEGPVDRQVVPLVARLRDEADLCRNEGATDIAALLDEAAEEMHNLAWALSLPRFDRMATDEQEAEHQAGVQRVNDVLARMEKAKAEHDAAMADAARWRYWRNYWPALCRMEVARFAGLDLRTTYVQDPAGMDRVTDEAMTRHNVRGKQP